MGLVTEYALTPDVFDSASYSNNEVCGLHLQILKEVFLQEALVRNLRAGDWGRAFSDGSRTWHARTKEIVRKLLTQNRLVAHPAALPIAPTTDEDWCDEALATHASVSLDGIIVSKGLAVKFTRHSIVSSVDRLNSTAWWTSRSSSVRLTRTIPEYKAALGLVMRQANNVMLIDPHIDPTQKRYQDLATLLQLARGRSPAPTLEIHRVCYRGSGQHRELLTTDQLRAKFHALAAPLSACGLSVDVFIWDDFHDRYLISDIVGITVPNGFDTSQAAQPTTWTRLGRNDRDDVQREFDPNGGRHALRGRFSVP